MPGAKRKKLEPLARFRVRISDVVDGKKTGHRREVYFNVWRTLTEMRRHGKENCYIGILPRALAFCHGYERYQKNGQLAADFAEINFCVKHLGVGVISHECLHATITWARLERLDGALLFDPEKGGAATDEEEELCWIHGELIRCAVNELYEHGLLKSA